MNMDTMRQKNFLLLTLLVVGYGLLVSAVFATTNLKSQNMVLSAILFVISIFAMFLTRNFLIQFIGYTLMTIFVGLTGFINLTIFNFIIIIVAMIAGVLFERILYKENIEKVSQNFQSIILIIVGMLVALAIVLPYTFKLLIAALVLLVETGLFQMLQFSVSSQEKRLNSSNCMYNIAIIYVISIAPIIVIEIAKIV